jgi:hypothetical protein
MFMPELRDFVFAGRVGSPSKSMQLLNEINAVRNRWAHGDMTASEIQCVCDDCEKMVDELLKNMQFMEEYYPYYVQQVSVSRRRHQETSYSHTFYLLTNAYQSHDEEIKERNWHTDTDDIIIEKEEGGFLNLQPFFFYLDSEKSYYSPDIRPDLYVFNGFEKSKQGSLIIRYLPCGNSGEPFTTSELGDEFEAQLEAELLSTGLQEYLQMFTELKNS